MKHLTIIAALVGLPLGIVVRRTSPPPLITSEAISPTSSPRSRTLPADEAPPELSWDIRGNLTIAEINDLPPGARRSAEMTFWSLKATSEEFADHWDKLIASGFQETYTLDHLATLWVRRHPDAALAHLRGSDQEYRFWWAIGRVDQAKGLALIDPLDHENFEKLLRGIAYDDPEFVLTTLDENPNLGRGYAIGGVIDGLFESDPVAAFELAAREDHYDWSKINQWAERDPQKAFAWAVENHHRTLGKHNYRKNLVPDLVGIVMEKDPDFATATIAALPTGSLKRQLLGAQAKHLAITDPEKALQLANSNEGQVRQHLLQEIANGTAQSNPDVALGILETIVKENLPVGQQIQTTSPAGMIWSRGNQIWREDFTKTLLNHDPDAVMALAKQADLGPQSDHPLHRETPTHTGKNLTDVFHQWQSADPQTAHSWISRQPMDENRDRILDASISAISHRTNFASLLNLSQLHSQEEKRADHDRQIARIWHSRSPAEAASFFNSDQATSAQQAIYQKLTEKP